MSGHKVQSLFLSGYLFVSKREVKLPFFHISLGYLYLHSIAQLVLMAEASAHKTVVALVEVVVIVIKIAHVYDAFSVVLVYLTVYSVTLYSADVRFVSVSYLVRHKLHHLVFY